VCSSRCGQTPEISIVSGRSECDIGSVAALRTRNPRSRLPRRCRNVGAYAATRRRDPVGGRRIDVKWFVPSALRDIAQSGFQAIVA
jgi:hypothetical protein